MILSLAPVITRVGALIKYSRSNVLWFEQASHCLRIPILVLSLVNVDPNLASTPEVHRLIGLLKLTEK